MRLGGSPIALDELGRNVYKIRKDIGFIALILKINVALWIIGFALLFFGGVA